MDSIAINISIEDRNLIITFEPESERKEKIEIETIGDIDLSEYVEELTYLINDKPKLIINKCEIDDSKLNLVQNTINSITESFNEIINEDDEQIDVEIQSDE